MTAKLSLNPSGQQAHSPISGWAHEVSFPAINSGGAATNPRLADMQEVKLRRQMVEQGG